MSKVLEKIFYNLGNPYSYSSPQILYKAPKQHLPDLTLKQVKNWLASQKAYVAHKQSRHRFPRRKVITSGIDYQWEADLAVLEAISRYNKGYKYLLVLICSFSRYVFVVPTKKKTAAAIAKAFEPIFITRSPRFIASDAGGEFLGKPVQDLFEKYNVKHFVLRGQPKCSIVERVIRTLKSKMFKYFTAKNTLKYIDVLDDLVSAYNDRYHRTIQMSPSQVNKKNEKKLWKKLYGEYLKKQTRGKTKKFDTGDLVVITKKRKPFSKSYLPQWGKEKYMVVDELNTNPPVWRLMDMDTQQILKPRFYVHELQKVFL